MKLPNYSEAKNREKVDIKYLDVNIKYDEVYKDKKYWSEEEVTKFMNINIGKWCIFVKKDY